MTLLFPTNEVKLPSGLGGIIGGHLKRGVWCEQKMLSYISSLNLTGTYLDIGANIGNHTIYFLLNTTASKVISVEPNTKSVKVLKEFYKINNIEKELEIIPYAAAHEAGQVRVAWRQGQSQKEDTFECVRLDEEIDVPISLIKIDVEGHEADVLNGLTSVLKNSSPIIFVEAHSDTQKTYLQQFLMPFGYGPTGRVFNASPTYEFVCE